MCAFILHLRECSVPLELVVNCFKLAIPIMREVKDKQKICSLWRNFRQASYGRSFVLIMWY